MAGADRRDALLLSVLLIVAGSAGLAATLLGAPTASAQSNQAQIEELQPTPLVLPSSGGTVTLALEVTSDLEKLRATVRLSSPQGEVETLEPVALVNAGPGTATGEVVVPVAAGGPYGWWDVRVVRMTTVEDNVTREVPFSGETSTRFYVHPLHPVAGHEVGPAWAQPGGDPMHSGRSLSLGPSDVPLVRWSFRSGSTQPFHGPVIGEDGTIYALSWGAELYALSNEGQVLWQRTFAGGDQAPHPPAILPEGGLVVAIPGVGLMGLTAGGAREWTWEPTGEQGNILAGPTIGPDGSIFVIQDPWTLVRLDTDGEVLSETVLERPDGLSEPVPRIPGPTERPRIAVTADGHPLVVAGQGLAVLDASGNLEEVIACNCTPRSVSAAPTFDIVLLGAGSEVVALSLRTSEVIWTTDGLPIAQPDDTVWSPPAIGWEKQVYLTSEDSKIYAITLDGDHLWNRGGYPPLRGQVLVDGNGRLFLSDARRGLWALEDSGAPLWTKTIDWDSTTGLSSGLVLTRSGALLWPSPDGALRMLGSNRLPVAAFDVNWTGEAYRFDAGASHDPDGAPLTYTWSFGDGSTASGAVVTHPFESSGTHTIKLTVTDGISTASTSQTLDVNFPPDPVIVDESDGLEMVLNATGTTDAEGDPITYTWHVDGEPVANGSVLAFEAAGPRVYDVTLNASDGNLDRTRSLQLLAPASGLWTSATLALYENGCPGLCTLPNTLTVVEDGFVQLLVVNSGSRQVEVSSELEPVTGGTNQITLTPGEKGTLHLAVGDPGSTTIQVQPTGQTPGNQVPVTIQPAPSRVQWELIPPEDPPRAGAETTYQIHLQGPPPPALVDLEVSLRAGVEEVVSRQVSFGPNEPINATVPLTFVPGSTGPLEVQGVVESLDTQRAVILSPASEDRGHATEVLEPTLFSRAKAALSQGWIVPVFLGLLIVGLLGTGGWYLYRRGRATGKTTAQTASASTPNPDGDGTVAAGFMPRKIERFHIERVLGEGGFGTTYLATDSVLERQVVLKAIEHVGQGQSHELLLHEAKTAANLSHPNVVVVHDVIEEEGRLLLVMEHVEGGTLQKRLDEGALSPKEALSIFADILAGLGALHDAGIVHRDVKPSNILITQDGVAKITDFGVAARIEDAAEGEDTFVGTPRYMAPEQLDGKAPGSTADLYAAGALLYEMLTGEHHLGLSKRKTPPADELLERSSQLPAPGVPEPLNDVLAKALARSSDDRYQSAKAFKDDLRVAYKEGKEGFSTQHGTL